MENSFLLVDVVVLVVEEIMITNPVTDYLNLRVLLGIEEIMVIIS